MRVNKVIIYERITKKQIISRMSKLQKNIERIFVDYSNNPFSPENMASLCHVAQLDRRLRFYENILAVKGHN